MPESDFRDLQHVLITQCDFEMPLPRGKLNPSWHIHRYQPFFSGTDVPTCAAPYPTPDQLLLYGSPLPNNTEAFCEQAQAAQYQQYKALFEGLNARMWTSYTGRNLWRSQCGWPGLRGFLYDSYLESTAGLFGARIAGAPINVQINLHDFMVAVVNNTAADLPAGLRIDVHFCDMNGKRRNDLDKYLVITNPVPAGSVQAFDLGLAFLSATPLVVVRTMLTASSGLLAKNLDWIATPPNPPNPSYAPLRALTQVNLNASGKGQYDRSSGRSEVTIAIGNSTDTLAFFNRVRVWNLIHPLIF